MPQWDYFILKFERENGQWRTLFQEGWTPLEKILPDMGNNGWELVSVTPTQDHQTLFALFSWSRTITDAMLMIFKRPRVHAE